MKKASLWLAFSRAGVWHFPTSFADHPPLPRALFAHFPQANYRTTAP